MHVQRVLAQTACVVTADLRRTGHRIIARMSNPTFKTVAVIGAGAMGRGIAQIATQSGSQVLLYDTQAAVVEQARQSIFGQWDKMAAKGKLTPEQAEANKQRLQAASELSVLPPTEN